VPRTLSIDSTSTSAMHSFDAYAKNRGHATTTGRVIPFQVNSTTQRRAHHRASTKQKSKESKNRPTIEESQESSSCLENCSVLPQIKKLSSVSEGFSENQKISQKIGRFLGKSETFFSLQERFLVSQKQEKNRENFSSRRK